MPNRFCMNGLYIVTMLLWNLLNSQDDNSLQNVNAEEGLVAHCGNLMVPYVKQRLNNFQ